MPVSGNKIFLRETAIGDWNILSHIENGFGNHGNSHGNRLFRKFINRLNYSIQFID